MSHATDAQIRTDCRSAWYLIDEYNLTGTHAEVPEWITITTLGARRENAQTRAHNYCI